MVVHDVCIIEDFILPALQTKQFDNLLEWVDEDEKTFRVFWSHKSGRLWETKYFKVFLEWDQIKGRTNQDEPGFFTESKGRFRSALNRLKHKVTKLQSSAKGYRYYKLKVSGGNSRHEHLAQERQPYDSSSPSSPNCSIASDSSEDLNCKNDSENCDGDKETRINIVIFNEQEPVKEGMYYDMYVPDIDQYNLDSINEDVQFNEIQEQTLDDGHLLLSQLTEDGIPLDFADTEFSTIDLNDISDMLDFSNMA